MLARYLELAMNHIFITKGDIIQSVTLGRVAITPMDRYKCARCGREFDSHTRANMHVVDDHPDVVRNAVESEIEEV